ncbi:hypothetical protein [Mycobacteroides abscessus]
MQVSINGLYPLPVEITNASPAWMPWLPVLGSVIVAVAAFVGVFVSNRTNRKAIAASDARDHDSWRKSRCLDAAISLLEHSMYLSTNVHQIHTDLLYAVGDHGYGGTLLENTDEFFFRKTHPVYAKLEEHQLGLQSAQAAISSIAPYELVSASARLMECISEMIENQQESMRFYYLLMCTIRPQRGRQERDSTSGKKGKSLDYANKCRQYQRKHESAMYYYKSEAISLQAAFMQAFRKHLAGAEDDPLQHMQPKDKSKRILEYGIEFAGPFREFDDNPDYLPEED